MGCCRKIEVVGSSAGKRFFPPKKQEIVGMQRTGNSAAAEEQLTGLRADLTHAPALVGRRVAGGFVFITG
jgi:hypothetical protein